FLSLAWRTLRLQNARGLSERFRSGFRFADLLDDDDFPPSSPKRLHKGIDKAVWHQDARNGSSVAVAEFEYQPDFAADISGVAAVGFPMFADSNPGACAINIGSAIDQRFEPVHVPAERQLMRRR